MARYIITEKQERLLREIHAPIGRLRMQPVIYFYKELEYGIIYKKPRRTSALVKEFFRNEMGFNIDKWKDESVLSYLEDITSNETSSTGWNILKSYPKALKSRAAISSLAYYLMKNLFKPQEYQGLEYIKQKDTPLYKFYFFDPEIQEFIGYMETKKSLELPGKSMKVGLSAIEEEYIGRGYGGRMYLCVLDQVDYLMSDNTLYSESLSIWVNYLPKKVNVWAELDEIDEDNETKVIKLSPKIFIEPDNIEALVASSKKEYPPDYSNL